MSVFRLPASGVAVELRPPGGHESVLLAEAQALDLRLAIHLLARLAPPAGLDWASLPFSDVDATLLELRRRLLGDRVVASLRCRAEGCGQPFDLVFDLGEYLAHHAASVPAGIERDGEPGWFRFADRATRFRLPTGKDLVEAGAHARPELALAESCAGGSDKLAAIESALEVLAPDMCSDLEGTCPECGHAVTSRFDPTVFVLHELRSRAAGIFDEVHLLAARYHWSEADILALPDGRRARYVERVARERALGMA